MPNDGHLLVVSHILHSEERGGAYKLAEDLAHHVAAKRGLVYLVCGTRHRNEGTEENRSVVLSSYRLPRLQSPSLRNVIGHIHGSFRAARRVTSVADVCFMNAHAPLQYVGTSIAIRGRRILKTYSAHSPFTDELRQAWEGDHSLKKKMAIGIARFIERWIYNDADIIQCDSRYTIGLIENQFGEHFHSKLLKCPGCVDIDRFRPPTVHAWDFNQLRLPEAFDPRRRTLVSVRRIENRMGLKRLLTAASRCFKLGYNFQILIGGEGSLRRPLEDLARELGIDDRVFVLGMIPEEDLAILYGMADCFILPTDALECFGLVVLEAYACETPVIGTPVGSIPEVMGQDQMEWVCDENTTDAIVTKICQFLDGKLSFDPSALRKRAEDYSETRVLERLHRIVTAQTRETWHE